MVISQGIECMYAYKADVAKPLTCSQFISVVLVPYYTTPFKLNRNAKFRLWLGYTDMIIQLNQMIVIIICLRAFSISKVVFCFYNFDIHSTYDF